MCWNSAQVRDRKQNHQYLIMCTILGVTCHHHRSYLSCVMQHTWVLNQIDC